MTRKDRTRRSAKDRWSGWAGRVAVPEEALVRLWSWVLWSAVLLAAFAGVAAWMRPAPEPVVVQETGADETVGQAWGVAGFAERFVTAWLAAGPDAADVLRPFLGYAPSLPSPTVETEAEAVGVVRTVEVAPLPERHWAVTVAAGGSDGERFWRVGVVGRSGGLVAVGLPSPVAAPGGAEGPARGVSLSAVPVGDDPLVETVTGFVAAHACGEGPLERWLAPDATVVGVDPPVCAEAELERWGAADDGEGRQMVVVEVVLDPHEQPRRVTYAVAAALRDGRWEIAELLPAPPADLDAGEVGS